MKTAEFRIWTPVALSISYDGNYCLNNYKRTFCDVVANVQDCRIVVSEFELKLRYYVHF